LVVGVALLGIAGAVTAALWVEERALATDLGRQRDLHGSAHAGSAACRRCHPEQARTWSRTFHRTMTVDVTPDRPGVVAGPFDGTSYAYDGVVARMRRDDRGRFVMSFDRETTAPGAASPDGASVEAVVVRAVGSRRYQQYLAEVDGALWRLPVAYHVEEKRWFHMNGAFLTPDPAGDDRSRLEPSPVFAPRFGGGAFDRHVTRWNDNCVFCHNVAANPGRDAATGRFATEVAELGIACEACHGPGAEHGRRNADPVRRLRLQLLGAADPTIVNPSRLSPGRSADVCGRCHGQRIADDVGPFVERGDPFVPGDDLALYSAPLWRDTALAGDRTAFAARFWDDGTPRLTAYEYQGLLQSACAQRGTLTCITCHGMHEGDPRGQVRPAAAGDRACTACHAGLAAPAAAAAHSRHDPAGAGGRCAGCHMPRIVYGVLDVHPSHRIEVPDPARAVATGRPDACTLCHVERDRAWAAIERARLWPAAPALPGRGAGARPAAAAAAAGDAGALGPRDALYAGDPVARALAADALGLAPAMSGHAAAVVSSRAGLLLESMAGDRYPAVRHLAARALARLLEPGLPAAAAQARAFDPTAPAPARARQLAELRAQLALPPASLPPPSRVAALRRQARAVDIDIGE
jgi:hypothetical protein